MGFLRIDGVTRALGDKVSPLRVEALLEMFEGHVDVEMHSDWPSESVLDPVCFRWKPQCTDLVSLQLCDDRYSHGLWANRVRSYA